MLPGIEALISNFVDLRAKNSPLIKSIANLDLLLEGLRELDKMIEIDDVKNSIVVQIKFLIVNVINEKEKKLDGHMVHTVLSGKSGCGKTALGIILAKIWIGLGLIKNSSISTSISTTSTSSPDKEDEKVEIIKRLQNRLSEIKSEVKGINLSMNNYRLRELRRELTKINFYAPVIEDIIKTNNDIILKCNELSTSLLPDERVAFIKIVDQRKSSEDNELEPRKFDLIRIVSREDFVGGYLGQTAIKTEKLLRDSLGKILFIDEAYSLVNDEKDSFGHEAVTVLNRFMSEYSDSLIIIFAGYKDLLDQTIFKAQPGLKRRCSWYFEIKGYSDKGLAQIFTKQLEETGWDLVPDLDLISFFAKNKDEFPNYGGSTLQFSFYCKLCYSAKVFDNARKNNMIIDQSILDDALEYMKNNKTNEEKNHHLHMFL